MDPGLLQPTPSLSRRQPGFTMVELIVMMIVIGILAVAVLPRFDLLRGFDEVGYRDQVKATLEYARKSAVAQRRSVRVTLAGNNLTLNIETCHPEGTLTSTPPCAAPVALGTFPRELALPARDTACGGATNQVCAPDGVTMTGTASLRFTPLGRLDTDTDGSYNFAGVTITVEAETGYVRH